MFLQLTGQAVGTQCSVGEPVATFLSYNITVCISKLFKNSYVQVSFLPTAQMCASSLAYRGLIGTKQLRQL